MKTTSLLHPQKAVHQTHYQDVKKQVAQINTIISLKLSRQVISLPLIKKGMVYVLFGERNKNRPARC